MPAEKYALQHSVADLVKKISVIQKLLIILSVNI